MKSRVNENIGKTAMENAMSFRTLPNGDREVTFNEWVNNIIWSKLSGSYRSTRWVITEDNLWFVELKTAGGKIYKTGLYKTINDCILEANKLVTKQI